MGMPAPKAQPALPVLLLLLLLPLLATVVCWSASPSSVKDSLIGYLAYPSSRLAIYCLPFAQTAALLAAVVGRRSLLASPAYSGALFEQEDELVIIVGSDFAEELLCHCGHGVRSW